MEINNAINIKLPLYIWQEGNLFFRYLPSLEILGYGENEEIANSSFEITLSEFLNYTFNKMTVFDELERLGWTVNRNKKRICEPNVDDLISDNLFFRNVSNKSNLRIENHIIQINLP